MKPLAIDLFCGLGGWADGFLAEGYDVIGFDIERHDYGTGGYPGQLVVQDVLTLHGSQFKDAAVIVASPPCQKYSYMAMPWTRAKQLAAWYREDESRQIELNALFNACFRIAEEAGVPLIVENVRGAQPWVGQSRWHYGSFHLWGDVPALMPITFGSLKNKQGTQWRANGCNEENRMVPSGVKVSGLNWSGSDKPGYVAKAFNDTAIKNIPHKPTEHWTNPSENGSKQGGECWHVEGSISRMTGSKSSARKAASAQIAKIPFPLARHIARVFKNSLAPESELCEK